MRNMSREVQARARLSVAVTFSLRAASGFLVHESGCRSAAPTEKPGQRRQYEVAEDAFTYSGQGSEDYANQVSTREDLTLPLIIPT